MATKARSGALIGCKINNSWWHFNHHFSSSFFLCIFTWKIMLYGCKINDSLGTLLILFYFKEEFDFWQSEVKFVVGFSFYFCMQNGNFSICSSIFGFLLVQMLTMMIHRFNPSVAKSLCSDGFKFSAYSLVTRQIMTLFFLWECMYVYLEFV